MSIDVSFIEEKIGYSFKEKKYLVTALTHSSYANEKRCEKNERLEFLGDAVLELITSHYLFNAFPKLPEGALTKKRAGLVCEQSLAVCARKLKLNKGLLLGKGEEAGGGRERDSILADCFEAVLGAIYLDGGIDAVKVIVTNVLLEDVSGNQAFIDYKTKLQEKLQRKGHIVIEYRLIDENGPDHHKTFQIQVVANEKVLGEGKGNNKKTAEQQAAKDALEHLNK